MLAGRWLCTRSSLARISLQPTQHWQTTCINGRSPISRRPLSTQLIVTQQSLPDGKSNRYPSVLQEVADNMTKYPGCVILTKVGGFYELYFNQATEFGSLLNLKVAERKYAGGKVPMSGFPFFQLDRYLKVLVQDLGKHVAISEEFPRTVTGKIKSGGLLFERRVARIVTPGTLVDEKFIQPNENNFLVAVHAVDDTASNGSLGPPMQIGLAWMDLSTGEFYTQATHLSNLSSDLLRISPREIVLSQEFSDHVRSDLTRVLSTESFMLTSFSKPIQLNDISSWEDRLEQPIPETSRAAFTGHEVHAGNILLEYVRDQLLDSGLKLQVPIKRVQSENMGIDKNTMRGLEILERAQASSPGGKGSLLHAIRRTVTKGGARLLRERISSPSTSLQIIEQRLDLVAALVGHASTRNTLITILEQTFDSQRIAQKFTLGKGDADDLVSLHRTITATAEIVQAVQEFATVLEERSRLAVETLLTKVSLEGPRQLAQTIAHAIDEDALLIHHLQEAQDNAAAISKARDLLTAVGNAEDAQVVASRAKARGLKLSQVSQQDDVEEDVANEQISETEFTDLQSTDTTNTTATLAENQEESWIMRRSASPTLQQLHLEMDDLRQQKSDLVSSLKETTTATSLTLRWTPGLGHHIHVKGVRDIRNTIDNLPSARSVGSSKSTRTFYITEWSKLGTQIDQLKLNIKTEEQRVFQTLREGVIANLAPLRSNAAFLDELDVSISFAILSTEQKLTRPILNNTLTHNIIDGRHPTVMLGLEEQGRSFVSNNCTVGDQERIWLITGPNMAGKSTFLRQNALISILAQVGCFVPAKHAEIGIVDQIFSRIGSADNLYQDQSTFMIEMLETAHILHSATPRSFVIMDEIGRGTTPEDGIAVGYACLHHLYHINKCRTLFATHFHKLCDMTMSWGKMGRYCTDVREDGDGSFGYVHRLREGVNRESHALKVAQLAGIPAAALKVISDVKASLMVDEPGKQVVKDDERIVEETS